MAGATRTGGARGARKRLERVAGRERVAIQPVAPVVDGGRFAAKATLGEPVLVEADVFADGHDELAVEVLLRRGDELEATVRLSPRGNDRWTAEIAPSHLGAHGYTLRAWVDRFATWRRDLERRLAAGQDVAVDLLVGADLVDQLAAGARGHDRDDLEARAARLRGPLEEARASALDPELRRLAAANPDRLHATELAVDLPLWVDRERARFSTWYELFPRSAATMPGRHGTLVDATAQLGRIARMGFDVVYLPPVHPIGRTFRKGRDNAPEAEPDDPGSPWAIGAEEGGHADLHPDLGTLADFDGLVREAAALGLEVALDLAFQASPDHPWVREHPEWFRARPDGTIQYAENPPKRYQDIYPFDFESEDWQGLWTALADVTRTWIDRGIRIFRVDNPHTKAFGFWEWLIGEIHRDHPDVLFLAEAFTRPRVMERLAKVGFSQSYTYFTWRSSAWELRTYLEELTRRPLADYFRPNLWPTTPDILTAELAAGNRATFVARLVLAATLSPSYGLYGPPYEALEHRQAPGREEYAGNEKYEIRHWELDQAWQLGELIGRVNAIRRSQPALQTLRGLRFLDLPNERLLAYCRRVAGGAPLVCVVNLDPHATQAGLVELPLADLGLPVDAPLEVEDLLGGERYRWQGPRAYVELDPDVVPAHILRLAAR